MMQLGGAARPEGRSGTRPADNESGIASDEKGSDGE
jgi:hypothetical protein